MHEVIPLHLLELGQFGEIEQLLGCPEQVHRLEELGLRPGCRIEMVQPGSPCIVRFGGSKFCFRDAELCSIFVRTGAAA